MALAGAESVSSTLGVTALVSARLWLEGLELWFKGLEVLGGLDVLGSLDALGGLKVLVYEQLLLSDGLADSLGVELLEVADVKAG